jgi:hypothetical protein
MNLLPMPAAVFAEENIAAGINGHNEASFNGHGQDRKPARQRVPERIHWQLADRSHLKAFIL